MTTQKTNLMSFIGICLRAKGCVRMSESVATEAKESGSPDSCVLLLEVSLQKLSVNWLAESGRV